MSEFSLISFVGMFNVRDTKRQTRVTIFIFAIMLEWNLYYTISFISRSPIL